MWRPNQAFPLQGGRTTPPIRGKCPEGTKGHSEAVTDEGALLDRNLPTGEAEHFGAGG